MGVVTDMRPTGPHSVLCLSYTHAADAGEDAGKTAERLIPFVSVYVDQVDLAARRITVDWQTDY